MPRQLFLPILILLLVSLGTALVILFGKGYRLELSQGKPGISGTGLLVATSTPNGASVFVNGHLTTATDNTINLSPGEYTIKIFKEGYFPWEKKIIIQKEVVAKAEALLIPTAPKLESITASGIENPRIDPSLTKIAYTVSSESARKNGVYVLDMSSRPVLTLQSSSTQIADDTVDSFSTSMLTWSPDGKQLLATISATPTLQSTYLLNANEFNSSPRDVTATLQSVDIAWQEEKLEKEAAQIASLKKSLKEIIQKDFTILAWAPDETKILYQASQSAQLPIIIKPRLIGNESTPEDRELKKGKVYVYDLKEDKNYKILDSLEGPYSSYNLPSPIMWYPDSKHLLFVHDNKIALMDFDGLNRITVYAGPFAENYVYPWPNGSKILILTNLNNTSIPPNLYTISLK